MKITTYLSALLALLFLTFSAGCGPDEKSIKINVPTAGASGTLYAIGAAITHMWNEEIPHMRAASQSSPGGMANISMVIDGEADVSMAIAGNVYQAREGIGLFSGQPHKNLCLIAGLYLNPNQVVVSAASDIHELKDMKGKRIAISTAGSSVYGECETHLTAAGLHFPDDIQGENLSLSDALDPLQNGTIDGAWIMAGTPAGPVAQALQGGARLLSLDEDMEKKIKKEAPWYTPYTIPRGTYPGQEEDIHTTAVKMVMFTREDMDEDTIYRLTKTLWEHMGELSETHKALRGLTAKNAVKDVAGLPFHPGALRYYKEIGAL